MISLHQENDILEVLKQVCWSPSRDASTLLRAQGIVHGFSGIGAKPPSDVLSLKQIHSPRIFLATNECRPEHPARPEGDALWTVTEGTCVAVRTADCLPVLFASKDGKKVASAHAGWRGLASGVLKATTDVFLKEELPDLFACVGPAISREEFEVGPEVIDALIDSSRKLGLSREETMLGVAKGKEDRWHADLSLLAVLQLLKFGLNPSQIEVIQACTKSERDRWHSYRREGQGCGSNWSWIRCGG